MRIIRVFPRKTSATPDDEFVRINCLPTLFDEADEVHISVAFTWDIGLAERLAKQWESVAPVKIGGPATGERGGDFVPGMYLKRGHVITSRGCPNTCWFCDVSRREGTIRELQVNDGYIVQDSNLLATSKEHQIKVFEMLLKQKEKPRFTGGIDAELLTRWHCEWFLRLKPKSLWFAYDSPVEYDALVESGKLLKESGVIKGHNALCYVLIGYKGDTITKAEKRLIDTIKAGFMPQAMLYNRIEDQEWRRFQRVWANRIIVGSKIKKYKL